MAGVVVLLSASLAQADSVTMVSPETAQTDACSYVEKAYFEHFDGDPALYANVTFSNDIYVGDGQPLARDYFVFKFPGVTFDPATKTFYAAGDAGHRVPVAVMEDGWLGPRIRPLAGTCVYICNNGGTLQFRLSATTNPMVERAQHWVPRSGAGLASQESLSAR